MKRRGTVDHLEPKEQSADDRFIELVQQAMEDFLKLGDRVEPKDRNALLANCIKFIAVKNKLRGEDSGNYLDDD